MSHFGESRRSTVRTLGELSTVGLAFVLAVIIGSAVGLVLDRWFGSSPWFLLIFFFLGVSAGILNVLRMSSRLFDDKERNRSKPASH